MFRNILFPLDGTARCMKAVPWIVDLTLRMNARLTVLYVNRGYAYDQLALRDLRAELGHMASFHVAEGRAEDEIIRYAAEHPVDLIAMPTRGLSRLKRLFDRSVTQSVIERATCPVWTMVDGDPGRGPTKNVVCGVTHSEEALATVQRAAAVARDLDAELTLVYAVPEVNEGTLAAMVDDQPFLSVTAARRYLYGLAQEAGIHAALRAEVGTVERVFAGAVKALNAELLVLNRAIRRVAAPVQSLARRIKCPVLVTNSTAESVRWKEFAAPSRYSDHETPTPVRRA